MTNLDPRALRSDGRAPGERRPASFERDFTAFAAGSVLVTTGRTKVLCTASLEDRVPPWMRGSGKGWVTAEYSLLPGSSAERIGREAAKGRQSGQNPGDTAADRQVASGGDGSRRRRREPDHRGL